MTNQEEKKGYVINEGVRIAMSAVTAFLFNIPLLYFFYITIGFSDMSGSPIMDNIYLFLIVVFYNVLIAFIIKGRFVKELKAGIIILLVNLIPYVLVLWIGEF